MYKTDTQTTVLSLVVHTCKGKDTLFRAGRLLRGRVCVRLIFLWVVRFCGEFVRDWLWEIMGDELGAGIINYVSSWVNIDDL